MERGSKMKVFISQPMKDKTERKIFEKRGEVKEKLKNILKEDFEIIDTFFTDDAPPLEKLGRSIQLMEQADIVYFCHGYQYARGCYIEYMCAQRYGKTIMLETT